MRKNASRDSSDRRCEGVPTRTNVTSVGGYSLGCVRVNAVSRSLMLHPTCFDCDVFVHNRVVFLPYNFVSCGYSPVLYLLPTVASYLRLSSST